MKGAADSKQGVSTWLTISILLFTCSGLIKRDKAAWGRLLAPRSPALLLDYLKQAQPQSQPLKTFFKPPPFKLVHSVLRLSDPHPSILCSSAFSFSASSLTWRLYQFFTSCSALDPSVPRHYGLRLWDSHSHTPSPRSPKPRWATLSLPLFAGRENSGFVHISRTFPRGWPEAHSLTTTLYWHLISYL